jgi:hypothetical protein
MFAEMFLDSAGLLISHFVSMSHIQDPSECQLPEAKCQTVGENTWVTLTLTGDMQTFIRMTTEETQQIPL